MKLTLRRILLHNCVLFAVNFLQCFSQTLARDSDTFIDRNSTGIIFSADSEPGISNLEDLDTMLQVISERFSHVILNTGINEESIAAAQVNSRLKNSHFLPLNTKLSITFNKESELSLVLSEANSTLDLAFKANSIHPRTVTTLLLNVNDIENEKTENTSIELLSYIRNHTLGKQLQLGIWLDMVDCGSLTSVPTRTLRVLENTDLVIFHHSPTAQQVAFGAQKNVQNMIQRFSICEKRIRQSVENEVEILWSTTSSSFGEQGYTLEYFIEYWKLMTEWATENKQFIFFFEAFDTQIDDDDPPSHAHNGWWRLVEEDAVNIAKSFVEKLLDFYVSEQDITTQATTTTNTIWDLSPRNQATRVLPHLEEILCFFIVVASVITL